MKVKILWLVASGNYDDHSDGRCQGSDGEEEQEDWHGLASVPDLDGVDGQDEVEDDEESGEGSEDGGAVVQLKLLELGRKADGHEGQQDGGHPDGQVSHVEDPPSRRAGMRPEERHERLNEGQNGDRHADGRVGVQLDAVLGQRFDALLSEHQNDGDES